MSAKNPIPNPLCTQQNGSIAGENLGLMKPCSLRFSAFEQAFVYIWITTQASPLLQISFWFSVDSVQELASTSFILLEWFHPSTLHMIQWKKKKKKKAIQPTGFYTTCNMFCSCKLEKYNICLVPTSIPCKKTRTNTTTRKPRILLQLSFRGKERQDAGFRIRSVDSWSLSRPNILAFK